MEQEVFQRFLKNKYETELHHAQQRALHHQRFAKWSEWGLITLSAFTTILLAISSFLKEFPITPITAVCSAIVTAVAATMKSLRTQEKWSFYQELSNDLDNEYYLFQAKEGVYREVTDREAQFVTRIISLLKDAHQKMPQLTRAPFNQMKEHEER